MKFKKLIVSVSVVASIMVISQSAFADKKNPYDKRCPEKCTPGQGCEIDLDNCK